VYGKRKGRTRGSRNKGSTVRGEAIVSGLVPKARTSFYSFTQEEMAKPEYVGVKWPVGIKRIAKLWKELDDTTKDAYKRDEWRKQQDAMVQHGSRRSVFRHLMLWRDPSTGLPNLFRLVSSSSVARAWAWLVWSGGFVFRGRDRAAGCSQGFRR